MFASFNADRDQRAGERDRDTHDRDRDRPEPRGRRGSSSHSSHPRPLHRSGSSTSFNPFSPSASGFQLPPRRPSFSYSSSPFETAGYSPPSAPTHPRRDMRRSKSSPSPACDYEEDGQRRDSHDLRISPRFERDSLVDNLLLSFDKLGDGSLGFDRNFFGGGGGGFGFDDIPDDESVGGGSTRTGQTGYTRGRRSNSSSNYHAHLRGSIGGGSSGRRFGGSVDYDDEPGFGVTYGRRETHSRRGLSSAGQGAAGPAQANGLLDYDDAAPTPTVYSGPRDRSMTITGQQTETLMPTSSRNQQSLSRRPSNKSLKSLKRLPGETRDFFERGPMPPMPAFVTAPAPAVAPVVQTPTKASKPGFFRRVFGGGGSSAASNSPTTVTGGGGAGHRTESAGEGMGYDDPVPASRHGQQQAGGHSHHPLPPPIPATPVTPANQIKPKTSFFSRRRKKSMSEPGVAPAQLLQLPLSNPLNADGQPEPSPVSSLRAVMSPYLRSPTKTPAREPFANTLTDSQTSPSTYRQDNATIRAVNTHEPGSPKARPTFFADSDQQRRGSQASSGPFSSFGRSGTKFVKTNRVNSDPTKSPDLKPSNLDPLSTPRNKAQERPQTSPHQPSPAPQTDAEHASMAPPPIPARFARRSLENLTLPPPSPSQLPAPPTFTTPSWQAPEKERPILTMAEIEQHHSQELARRASENLGIDTTNLSPVDDKEEGKLGVGRGILAGEDSWLNSPTPVSATVSTPMVMVQMDGGRPEVVGDEVVEVSEAERERARRIYEGDEGEVVKEKAAHVLAEIGPAGARLRQAYLSLYDFSTLNILSSLRLLCSRLILRGESQEMDRLIDAVSKRWVECNPNHGFKTTDVVHTIIYSILLLNTDLHMADLRERERMTRGQFLKNTMQTVRRGLESAGLTGKEEGAKESNSSLGFRSHGGRPSIDYGRGTRNSSKASNIGGLPSPRLPPEDADTLESDGNCALVNKPLSGGNQRAWENQVEFVLKDFYNSLKETALPLHGVTPAAPKDAPNSLSVFGNSMLRRSPSTVSKAGSEHSLTGSRRGPPSSANVSQKWGAKNRSRPRFYNGSTHGSSRTSLEERSIWSPTGSSTWSKLSLNHTATSTLSIDSLGSAFIGNNDYQQSIGFANALSHAIIREESTGSNEAHDPDDPAFIDEDLELVGPPFAKEGMLKHKHHLESVDKKAKSRSWTEIFAVVEKGYVRMFQFSSSSGVKSSAANAGVVGGGNWSENANSVGYFTLRQTLASALPPPGYSKTRPHVWALSLPTGAVHLFQAGSAETAKEWVTTANYWSARLSKEPLVGGVSNVEYGWGSTILCESDTGSTFGPRPSLQESVRSSFDTPTRPRLPGDKVLLSDWTPPPPSLLASPLPEAAQLKALTAYVANIEAELARHNEVRGAMMAAFSQRHPNAGKAERNWEKKSSYLLHEIVKFRTYCECLERAGQVRRELKAEREEREGRKRSVVSGEFGPGPDLTL